MTKVPEKPSLLGFIRDVLRPCGQIPIVRVPYTGDAILVVRRQYEQLCWFRKFAHIYAAIQAAMPPNRMAYCQSVLSASSLNTY